jgi:hypothetical protein
MLAIDPGHDSAIYMHMCIHSGGHYSSLTAAASESHVVQYIINPCYTSSLGCCLKNAQCGVVVGAYNCAEDSQPSWNGSFCYPRQ